MSDDLFLTQISAEEKKAAEIISKAEAAEQKDLQNAEKEISEKIDATENTGKKLVREKFEIEKKKLVEKFATEKETAKSEAKNFQKAAREKFRPAVEKLLTGARAVFAGEF
jgi:uncharacterized membrane protein